MRRAAVGLKRRRMKKNKERKRRGQADSLLLKVSR
jgi:hypothetical protein